MSLAFCCQICDGTPRWRVDRYGDAAVTWACNPHLPAVCHDLQRDFEITKLAVTDYQKLRERAKGNSMTADLVVARTGNRHIKPTRDFLRQVAAVHRKADATGELPTAAIAEHFGISRVAALRLVAFARQIGELESTE